MEKDDTITAGAVAELLGRWWYNYDQGEFAVLETLLTEDIHFTCRTDTGVTDYEEFVRADLRGRAEVMAWQTDHRRNSPFPLRHNGTNLHLRSATADTAQFSSYIFVTAVAEGRPVSISSGLVSGAVALDRGTLRIAALEVVLDTMDSVPFSQAYPAAVCGSRPSPSAE